MKKGLLSIIVGLLIAYFSVIHAQTFAPLHNACYRCLKPSHYGVRLYPRMQNRNTCSDETAQYLHTMGYRCYKNFRNDDNRKFGYTLAS